MSARTARWERVPKAAVYANIPERTMRDWIAKGILPGWRLGPRQLQVDLNDVDRLRRRVPAAGSVNAKGTASGTKK